VRPRPFSTGETGKRRIKSGIARRGLRILTPAIHPEKARRIRAVALVLLAAGFGALLEAPPVSAPPILNLSNGHYYEAIAGNVTWTDAEGTAQARMFLGCPGHLATITSQPEQDWIVATFPLAAPPGQQGYWIGGSQPPGSPEPAGNWAWVTSEPFTFTAWMVGEPNNVMGIEDALQLDGRQLGGSPRGAWNDYPRAYTLPGFVVEYECPYLQTPYLSPPRNLRTVSLGTDVDLTWEPPTNGTPDYYWVHRGATPRGIDLIVPYARTVGPETAFTDLDAAAAPGEAYYVVRAVNVTLNVTSVTSNTAGAFTRAFGAGLNAFSLPLEPFFATTVAAVHGAMTAVDVRYLDDAGVWQAFPGAADIPLRVGRGLAATLASPRLFTFVGFPGSMILHGEGFGFAADEARSLVASVNPAGDVELAWAPPVAYGEAYCVRRSAARDGFHTGAYATLGCTLPGRPDLTTYVDAGAAQTAGEWYYQVVPVLNLPGGNGSAPSIMNGSTTYSIGIWTSAFAGSQAFGLPLRPETPRSVDWWASAIPGALGILWLSTGTWVPHFTEMPAGVYDAPLPQGGAVQVQVRTPARYAFVGT